MEKIYLDRIIGSLGAIHAQRAWIADRIISDHVEEAFAAAKALKAELAKSASNNGDKCNEIYSQQPMD